MFGLFKKPTYVPHPSVGTDAAVRQEIVGESFYERAVEAMYRASVDREQPVWVTLVPEPSNQHDRNAIKVEWVDPSNGRTVKVGHIAKAETKRWRGTIAAAPRGSRWMWPAQLTGTPETYIGIAFFGAP